MISTNQFKNGTHIEVDGKIFRIVEFQHVKPGKGGAFVRTKLRRVDDGSVIDKTFRAGEKFRPVRTETRKMQYLYDSGDAAVFMDNARLRAARDPARRSPARRCSGCCPTTRSTSCSSTSGPAGVQVAERGRDGGHRDRARASRATPPPAAAPSRRRSSPG